MVKKANFLLCVFVMDPPELADHLADQLHDPAGEELDRIGYSWLANEIHACMHICLLVTI